jgi:hypothetical protein
MKALDPRAMEAAAAQRITDHHIEKVVTTYERLLDLIEPCRPEDPGQDPSTYRNPTVAILTLAVTLLDAHGLLRG